MTTVLPGGGENSYAQDGPNQDGVLWMHDTGLVCSSDMSQPSVSVKPADCAGVAYAPPCPSTTQPGRGER